MHAGERSDHLAIRGFDKDVTITQQAKHTITHSHSHPHLCFNTCTTADIRPRSPLRSRCRKEFPRRPAAVKATQIWSTAATTWAGSWGAAGTGQGTGSGLWPRPSERRRSGSMASPYPGSAPPWRHGRTCENTAGKENVRQQERQKERGLKHANPLLWSLKTICQEAKLNLNSLVVTGNITDWRTGYESSFPLMISKDKCVFYWS